MHLDVKPPNMMYFKEPNGEIEILKAIDFGTSKRLKRTGRRTLSTVFDEQPENRANFWQEVNEKVGTERYASPEIEHANRINEEECVEHPNHVHKVESAAESVVVNNFEKYRFFESYAILNLHVILPFFA
jgi:serine/threonine protein kinase